MQLGVKAKDVITGFVGVVVGNAEYLTGCTQYLLVPPCKENGDASDGRWFDVDRLEVTCAEPIELKVTANGPDIPAPLY